MSAPFVRSQGQLVSSLTNTLIVPIGARQPGDVVLLYTSNISWALSNVGRPAPPTGFKEILGSSGTSGFYAGYWARVQGSNFPGTVTLQIPDGSGIGGSWVAWADVIGNVSTRTPGWLDFPGTAGQHAVITRADLSSVTFLGFAARFQLSELGVDQWIMGWGGNDAGFGLNSANRPIVYVNNTLGNPIGNVAANADIPDLAVGKRIWIQARLTIATGEIAYYYAYTDVSYVNSVYWLPIGTPVTGTGAGTTVRVTNSDTAYIGTRSAAVAGIQGRVFNAMEYSLTTYGFYEDFSDPLSGVTLVGPDVSHIRPTDDDGDGSPIENFGAGGSGTFTTSFYVPARQVLGPDRLVLNYWWGYNGSWPGVHQDNPVSGPEGWTDYPDRAIVTHTLAQKLVTRSIVADDDTPDAPATKTDWYTFEYRGYTFRPRTEPFLFPTSPQPERITLGCAESYTVWFTDETYERTIEQARWSDLSWNRVLDDISTARATFPDTYGAVNCLVPYGGLEPWRYGLRIERNDQEVWSGPIVTVRRSGDAITVGASDILSRYQRRFASRIPAQFVAVDAGTVLHETFTVYAALATDAWDFRVPEVTVGVPVNRSFHPREFKYAWDFISELLDAAVDAYVMNGRLYIFEPGAGWRYQATIKRTLDGPYNTNYDFVYGTFTEEAWTQRPDWSIDGAGQANHNIIPAADSGEYGFRTFEAIDDLNSQITYGVLDSVDPDPVQVPQDTPPDEVSEILRARAESVSAQRALPPIILEGGVLSPDAPIDVDNLRPGSLWKMDVYDHGFGQLLTVGRLRRVTVDVNQTADGIEERVTPVLYPPGWEGDLG